ncbi:monocarboxylate transporter 13-like isoform X2 [Schistocerca piceifrons]|uniref:monocarboxylate transporter 13-like isoform X2 n=1 Tax=Schistocerca piceifrons TaxID=274613 RepID=UPI001F5EF8B9|nr:monocarboxylate transporter 13-like isoform X2 [Schistocerca piceifrons]
MASNDADAAVAAHRTVNNEKPLLKDEKAAQEVEDADDEAEAAYAVVPPDGGWGWVVMLAGFCCNLIVDGIISSFGMFLADISRDLGESKPRVAIVGSLLSGFYLMAGPFVSALANRYGFRVVAILGSVLGCISFALCYFANSVIYLCIGYGFLGGVGFGLVYVPAVIAVGFYFERWRALATGIAVCGSGIGTMLIAPLSSTLINTFGWRGTFLIQAGLVLNCAIFGALFRPLKPVRVKVEPEATKEPAELPLLLRMKMVRDMTTSANSIGGNNNMRASVGSLAHKRPSSVAHDDEKPHRVRTTSESSARSSHTPTAFRPLYKEDAFFGGSLARLSQYTSQAHSIDYHVSVSHLPTKQDIEEERECQLCPEAVQRALGSMLDLSLLQSPSFMLLSVSGFLTMMGFYVPFIYITACFASLRSLIIVDLLGLERLTNAFGLTLMFQGVAAAIGSPLAGAFMEATGSYDASFYLSGGLILASAIILYPLGKVNAWEKSRQKRKGEKTNCVI